MISKDECFELLTEYYESALTPERRKAIEERLKDCRVTAHVYETYEKTVAIYQRCMREKSAPQDFAERLLEVLRRGTDAKKP